MLVKGKKISLDHMGRMADPVDDNDDKAKDGAGDGGDDDKDKEKTYSQEEFLQTQKELEKTKQDLASLRKKYSGKAPAKDKDSSDPMSEEMKNALSTIKELNEKIKSMEDEKEEAKINSTKDENARELLKANKKIHELEQALEDLQEKYNKAEEEKGNINSKYGKQLVDLRNQSLKAEIYTYANKYNALSDAQIYRLTKDDFIYDEELDRWVVPVYDRKHNLIDGEEIEPYIKKFLTDPSNDNLVRSGAKGGTGGAPSSSAESSKTVFEFISNKKQDDSKKNIINGIKVTDAIRKEAMMNDMSVEDWVGLLKVKEEIQNKTAKK